MPYEENESTKSPDDWNSHVWRYLSTSQLLSIVERAKLRFTRTDKFPDPYEGDLPREVLENIDHVSLQGGLPEEVEKDKWGSTILTHPYNQVKAYRRIFFHNSWNHKEYESKAMWDNKSQDGEGVAIKTTAKNLRECFSEFEDDVFIGLMEYGDYEDEDSSIPDEFPDLSDWKNAHLHKPIEFEEENELRATVPIVPTPEADPFNDFSQYSKGEIIELDWSTQPAGVYVPINVNTLIQEVRLSPYANDWQKEVVKDVLKTHKIDAPVTKSNIYNI